MQPVLQERATTMESQQYKDLSIQEFTRAAAEYETGADHGLYEMCKDDYPPILEELRTEPFETLLDAGCGTAPMISLLAEEYPDRTYTGLDLTPAMIEVAKAKGLPNATFVVGDCENLPFPENSFDVVINSQSYHHYPNPQAFWNSVYRVLKPGGKVILRDNTGGGVLRFFGNKILLPLANRIKHTGDVAIYSLEENTQMAQAAGLTVEKCEQQKDHRLHMVARKPQ